MYDTALVQISERYVKSFSSYHPETVLSEKNNYAEKNPPANT